MPATEPEIESEGPVMDLHLMQLVKRLFAWADANDDTRNMELHMQVAFGLLAEQGAATTPKHALTAAELDVRDRPVIRQIQLTQSYRWERAKLASRIAEGLHCRFIWIGSLTQEAPTVGCFIGCRPHADRARLLFEVMDPDLRLLTRFIGPPQGAGWGASGPPPASARQYFASRSAAMLDVINWTYERLYETEVLAASRKGLADDFAEDRRLADEFVDEMWGDTMSVYDLGAGQPDYPMVDGLPAERFQEFLEELEELEAAEDEDAGLGGVPQDIGFARQESTGHDVQSAVPVLVPHFDISERGFAVEGDGRKRGEESAVCAKQDRHRIGSADDEIGLAVAVAIARGQTV